MASPTSSSSSQPIRIRQRTNNKNVRSKSSKSNNNNNNNANKISATHQAQSITSTLLRTKTMMEQELSRVTSLNTTISDDGALLSNAREGHEQLGGTMHSSKGVMKKLSRQDVRDAFILKMVVIFYWVVVGYVLWSRIKIPFLP